MSKALGTIFTTIVAFSTGVVTGLLLAPRSGKESRKWIAGQADDAKHWVEDKSHKLMEKSEERIHKISEGIKESIPDLYEATESINFEDEELEHNN